MNIREACHTLAISTAGYYAHQLKGQRQRRRQDAVLADQISTAFAASRRTYGSPRIMHALRHAGARHGKNRIARLMRQHGLNVQQKRRFVPRHHHCRQNLSRVTQSSAQAPRSHPPQ